MAFLEHHPIHVRKKIALGITFGVAAILIIVMILIYTLGKNNENREPSGSSFLRFYATILDNAQSFFSSNRDTIKE